MKQLLEPIWALTENTAELMAERDPRIQVIKGLFKEFYKDFQNMYCDIQKNYMFENVNELDRHKVAAIIAIAIVRTEPLRVKDADLKSSDGKQLIFLGGYYLALQVSMAYMLNQLNMELKSKNLSEVEKYIMPEALSCNTEYFDIMARNLYFSHNNPSWNLNPLDWAERFFLLEYITLKEKKIELEQLKEQH